VPAVETRRLRLVPITLEMVEGVLDHDKYAAEEALDHQLAQLGWPTGATFPDTWPNDDLIARAFPYSREAIRAAPEVRLWGDTLVVTKETPPRVLGSVVFKGRPTDGIAEVGYGIEDGSRGQGLATEATLACIEWALAQDGIVAVQAITFAAHLASLGVIANCGMTACGTREHPIFGELLVFERRRP
jgi:[ribosomal protein S5]-alanine N-acetyltransferase